MNRVLIWANKFRELKKKKKKKRKGNKNKNELKR